MKLSNKTYNIVKWVVLIFLPAFAVLYQTIGSSLGANTDVAVTIINAVALFLGAITGISTYSYNKNDKTNLED